MRARIAAFCTLLLAGSFPIAVPVQAAPTPTRTLVYAFELRAGPANGGPDNGVAPAGEIRPDDCLSGGFKVKGTMSSSIAAGNGGIDWFQVDCTSGFGYKLNATGHPQRGSIRVDMLGKQSDGSLIVQVAETPAQGAAAAATCVVFPTTGIVCDPNKPITSEEVTLLRFLAPGIVDPKQDRPHWEMQDGGPQSSFKATFSILQNTDGVLTIGEQRDAKGEAGPYSTDDSKSTFTYDIARAVPTAIDDSVVQKTVRYGQYNTTLTDTIYRLQPAASR
jgi:hypothetical protein